jgi:hypothetical protein
MWRCGALAARNHQARLTGNYLSILFALAPILLDSVVPSGQNVDDANSASSLSFLALRVYLPLPVQLVHNMPLPYHGY